MGDPFSILNISATGLTAERLRMDVISDNIANVNTTRTPEGGPYSRKIVLFSEIGNQEEDDNFISLFEKIRSNELEGGVKVVGIVKDQKTPFKRVYDPNHPDAGPDGYVNYPNINVVTEMVDMISASRAYEANLQVIGNFRNMAIRAIDILKG